ncbi:MAG: 23S rRNA (pseudouridine(1915)-N(3))-methyltransferase RlmH [Rhodobacteraceae bacterium]|nr:23S rRNA (pseudouridine(1915)-N(3))-methyltransferase RlmH [Paracoccaceae bacterium]
MRVTICAVGRLRAGPERLLIDDYLDRFGKAGRALGLGPAKLIEVDAKGAGMATEARLLERAVPQNTKLCVLDERGTKASSPELATRLATWRDDGQHATFIIGGADGVDPALRARADYTLSFGAMVWPHMLVRVMLAEQLYRAATILAGSPYHRS